jgi:hypothetical protein
LIEKPLTYTPATLRADQQPRQNGP